MTVTKVTRKALMCLRLSNYIVIIVIIIIFQSCPQFNMTQFSALGIRVEQFSILCAR
jgi:hypothetical protein